MSTVVNSAADRQFKGKGQCLIPKRSGGNIYMYKIVGVGPQFNVLLSWVYEIISRYSEKKHVMSKSDKTMIPQNVSTCTAIQLIEQLDDCTDSSTINYILDKKEYMQFISSSLWKATHEIIIQVCGSLIGALIYDKLMRKRKEQIKDMNQISNDEGFIIYSDILLLYANHALKIQVNKFNTKIF